LELGVARRRVRPTQVAIVSKDQGVGVLERRQVDARDCTRRAASGRSWNINEPFTSGNATKGGGCAGEPARHRRPVAAAPHHHVDWNSELLRGNLAEAVQRLKRESGAGLLTGGVTLPLALAELGLIDEYEFVVQPRLAGHGPTLFAGLSKVVDLKLVGREEFASVAVAMRYEPRR
jgi:hypothetical protein